MVGCQQFALQDTEPDLDLFEPGSVGWQPKHFDGQRPVIQAYLFLQPILHLFGCMGGAVVQDQAQGMHLAAERFREDGLQ